MLQAYFEGMSIFSWQVLTLLVVSGFIVGVINTFAGSGTVIGYSIFILLGLPAHIANGTTRLGVIMQTLAASYFFKKGGALDLRKGTLLAIPITLGSVLGAQIAVSIDKELFEKIVAVLMFIMLGIVFYKPERWLEGHAASRNIPPKWWHYALYFVIGMYGGFIHIGVGIFLMAALVLVSGYDLVNANGIKVYTVFIYSPFALAVFMYNNHLDYAMGLISAIGNLIGGIAASIFALKRGPGFVRWVLIVVMLLFALHLLGVFNF